MVVLIRLADKCNLKCRMCHLWNPKNASSDTMSLETFESILIKLQKVRIHGKKILNVRLDGNREALCYPKIVEAVSMARLYGFECWFVSNAVLLNEKMSNQLLDSGLNHITFSVSGITSETYSRFQGYGKPKEQFNSVCKNITHFLELKHQKGIDVSVKIAMLLDDKLSKLSNEYREALYFWRNAGVNSVVISQILPSHGLGRGLWEKQGNPDCARFPTILPNGDVLPCCGGKEDVVLGNILTEENVFMNENTVNLFRALKNPQKVQLPVGCNDCSYNYRTVNHVETYNFNLKNPHKFSAESFTHFLKASKDKDVFLYGCTELAKDMIVLSRENNINICGVIDNDFWKWGNLVDNVPVIGLKDINTFSLQEKVLCICTRDISDALQLFEEFDFSAIYAAALFFEETAEKYPVFEHIFNLN